MWNVICTFDVVFCGVRKYSIENDGQGSWRMTTHTLDGKVIIMASTMKDCQPYATLCGLILA
jgi:hypothetical protein